VRAFVFRLELPDDHRRDALASQLEDRLRADECSFDPWSMRLTVQAADIFDAQKIAKAVVWAATLGTDLYTEPVGE